MLYSQLLSAPGVETNPSALGDTYQEVADVLLDAMDLYEATAVDTFEEDNLEGTDIDGLIKAGESLLDAAHVTREPVTVVVQERIEKLEDKMKKAKDDFKPLQQAYTKLAGKVNSVQVLLDRLKKKPTDICLTRKKAKTGVKEKVVQVLNLVGVEIQQYHSGSLARMDVKKLITNAPFVFDGFEKMLKEERN
jgi:hypothetical protein